MDIQLTLDKNNDKRLVPFTVKRMVNAGFTGRDQEEVKKHLDELAEKGIDVPKITPLIYPVIPSTLTTACDVEVYGEESSPEVEFVLFVADDEKVYVGIGSDHTDRNLELHDIPRAKQICPNLISPEVWDLADVETHWDKLQMKCAVEKDGQELIYQDGSLAALMSPAQLMDFVSGKVKGALPGTVIFSGTVKMETEGFVYADSCACELFDPELDRKISFSYNVIPLNYMV